MREATQVFVCVRRFTTPEAHEDIVLMVGREQLDQIIAFCETGRLPGIPVIRANIEATLRICGHVVGNAKHRMHAAAITLEKIARPANLPRFDLAAY